MTIGIKKKLLALGKKKGCEEVNKWIKSIINHLYWCALSCSTDSPDLIEAKWVSLVNHMHNKHKHTGLFKKCAHSRLYRRKTKWIKPRELLMSVSCQSIDCHMQIQKLVRNSVTCLLKLIFVMTYATCHQFIRHQYWRLFIV